MYILDEIRTYTRTAGGRPAAYCWAAHLGEPGERALNGGKPKAHTRPENPEARETTSSIFNIDICMHRDGPHTNYY